MEHSTVRMIVLLQFLKLVQLQGFGGWLLAVLVQELSHIR